MNLAAPLSTFTLVHVAISLIAILSGVFMLAGMLAGRKLGAWNMIFLSSTFATSLTGFMFHSSTFGPPHIIGVISLFFLCLASFSVYVKNLSGGWRATYVIAAVMAFYLNVFVGVVQLFLKISFLNVTAPTQSEPPFVAAQSIVFLTFCFLGWNSIKNFRSAA